MKTSTTFADSSAIEKPSLAATCDELDSWKKIPIGVCTPVPANFVLTATKKLCHLLLLQEGAFVVMETAAKLAAQLRDLQNLDELLVNQVELQRVFLLRPDVRLDLSFVGYEETKFFDDYDTAERWQIDFARFADRLTLKQALAFGPWFACLLLKLSVDEVATVAADIWRLREMLHSFDELFSLDLLPDMDLVLTEQNIISLLSKYAGAMPRKVLFNTVFGGLIYAYYQTDLWIQDQGSLAFLVINSMQLSGRGLLRLLYTFTEISHVPLVKYCLLMELKHS